MIPQCDRAMRRKGKNAAQVHIPIMCSSYHPLLLPYSEAAQTVTGSALRFDFHVLGVKLEMSWMGKERSR
jgi:hypothetical protein